MTVSFVYIFLAKGKKIARYQINGREHIWVQQFKGWITLAFLTFKGLALYRENNCLNARTKWRKQMANLLRILSRTINGK